MSKGNELERLGDQLQQDSLIELGAMVGGAIAMGATADMCDMKRVELAKRIKETRSYEQTGLNWESFCKKYFGPRRTVEEKIRELEECGGDLFGLRALVRIGRSTYELMEVQDGHIMYGGERIAITKANEGRIKEIVAQYHTELMNTKEELAEKERAAEKAKEAAATAKKAAARVSDELREIKARATKPFAGATLAQSKLVLAQSRIVEAMELVHAAEAAADYDDETDAAWIESLGDFAVKLIVETTGHDPLTQTVARKIDDSESPAARLERAQKGVPRG
jgi:hypothetical protein